MAVKKKNVSLKMGKHKSRTGGLTAAGRRKYNKATGSNLKAPQPKGGGTHAGLGPGLRPE